MLDTSVLVEVCVPGRHGDAKDWFRRLLLAPSPPELIVSVLADYELRTALGLKRAAKSLEHFDELSKSIRFVPVSVEMTRRAVSLSLSTRLRGADMIIAAQAIEEGAVLVTGDRVFEAVQSLDVRRWSEIDPEHL